MGCHRNGGCWSQRLGSAISRAHGVAAAARIRCASGVYRKPMPAPTACEVSCLSRNLQEHMNFLILGRGKTGTLVAEVAAERKHQFQVAGSTENPACSALTAAKLQSVDAVIDFTTPHVVLAHIEACVKAGKNMVVGTTGWYKELDRVRALVERHRHRVRLCPKLFHWRKSFLRRRPHRRRSPAPRLLWTDFRAPSRPQEGRALRHRDRDPAHPPRCRWPAGRHRDHVLPRRGCRRPARSRPRIRRRPHLPLP